MGHHERLSSSAATFRRQGRHTRTNDECQGSPNSTVGRDLKRASHLLRRGGLFPATSGAPPPPLSLSLSLSPPPPPPPPLPLPPPSSGRDSRHTPPPDCREWRWRWSGCVTRRSRDWYDPFPPIPRRTAGAGGPQDRQGILAAALSPHHSGKREGTMNIKFAVLAALLLAPGQAMAEDIRVDCVTDQRIVCRDEEPTCRPPVRDRELAIYHFTFDLTKKTGSLVFLRCSAQKVSTWSRVRSLLSVTTAHSSTIMARSASSGTSSCGSRSRKETPGTIIQLAMRHDRKRHRQSQSLCHRVPRPLRRPVTGGQKVSQALARCNRRLRPELMSCSESSCPVFVAHHMSASGCDPHGRFGSGGRAGAVSD